jgi:putative ABC transport system ATP-binding protein
MNILGCLDIPSYGEYYIDGNLVGKLSDDQLSAIRNRAIGFIFQGYNLLPDLTALENVELPLVYRGVGKQKRERLAKAALEKVGLAARMKHLPSEMSGGQQQRVAIARAVATQPPIIMADEPTGNLDSKSGEEIMKILTAFNETGTTVILITHDSKVASYARRVLELSDGKIVSDRAVERTGVL